MVEEADDEYAQIEYELAMLKIQPHQKASQVERVAVIREEWLFLSFKFNLIHRKNKMQYIKDRSNQSLSKFYLKTSFG